MEPIISPWIIYALHIYDKIYFACSTLMIWSFVIAPLLALFGAVEEDKPMMKYAKISAIIAVVCAILLIVVPSKDMLITMLAASYITPDNIAAVQGDIVDFVKQVIKATK